MKTRGKAPGKPVGPILDVTRENATVVITSPRTGHEKRTLVIRTLSKNSPFAPGKRIVSCIYKHGYEQRFGWADDSGIIVWPRHKGNGKKSTLEWYADMLERPSVYAAKGYVYKVTKHD